MRMPWKILSAVLIAASAAWTSAPAGATPLASSLTLKNADTTSIETVEWRRGRYSHRTHPRVHARAYGAYAYAPARRYRGYGYGRGTCSNEESENSANPTWACPSPRW
jgi:hypothetical protein